MTDAKSHPSADPANWFIGVGVVTALVCGWFALDQPGVPLRDGDYGCSVVLGNYASLTPAGPGATVEDGEVVDVWDFSISSGEQTSLEWSESKRKSPKKFTVVSEVPQLDSGQQQTYECTLD